MIVTASILILRHFAYIKYEIESSISSANR